MWETRVGSALRWGGAKIEWGMGGNRLGVKLGGVGMEGCGYGGQG